MVSVSGRGPANFGPWRTMRPADCPRWPGRGPGSRTRRRRSRSRSRSRGERRCRNRSRRRGALWVGGVRCGSGDQLSRTRRSTRPAPGVGWTPAGERRR